MDTSRFYEEERHAFSTPQLQQVKVKEEYLGKGTIEPETQDNAHRFLFSCNSKKSKRPYEVTCKASMTIQEALCSNSIFKQNQKQNLHKELIIERENPPRGAVNTHFPCCLINKDENLNITFMKSDRSSSGHPAITQSPEQFIVFNIKTRGGKGIRKLMKNTQLWRVVDFVCVFAVKGDIVKRALKRDGRFREEIFSKHCGLSELGFCVITVMSNTVDSLSGKEFEVIVIDSEPPSLPSSLEMEVEMNESVEASSGSCRPESANADNSASDQQQKPPTTAQERTSGAAPKKVKVQPIPESEEILKILREQFGGLLKTLKERENFTKPAQVQKFFREEFDKSCQSFSEVKRVKQLMKLSDSVCQIRMNNSAKGTGFLLFDRFILTNAHVVGDVDLLTHSFTAVFDYEALNTGTELTVNKKLVARGYHKNDQGQHLDFALLELNDSPKRPELLKNYSPPPIRGGICIVGHPEGGVKRMDPCFIIEKDQVLNAADQHCAENSDFFHVITQQALAEKWKINDSQISYNSCFFHGASGSPVFNEHCQLIGIHTGGFAYKGDRGKTRSVIEYAYPMLPILVSIIRQCRKNGRSEVVQHFEAQNNMKHVVQGANEQDNLQEHQTTDSDSMDM